MVPEAAIKADLLSARLLTISLPLIVFGVGGYVYYLFVRMNRPHPVRGKLPPARVLKVANPPQKELIQKGLEPVVLGFYLAVEMKDPYTAGHTERVTRYALAIYDQMGEEQKRQLPRDDLRYAGLLHDIGKVAIPDHILQKEGKLTDEEYEQIKRHPTVGANLVEQIETLAHVSPGVRYHHERWDGKGYPEQLKGEEIPLAGRILAVADTFDAMTSSRTYRKALSPQTALEEILRCSDTQFDPYVVAMFAEAYRKGAIQARQQEGEAG
jgi:putative nucleotidyltransferase with HDIG domain